MKKQALRVATLAAVAVPVLVITGVGSASAADKAIAIPGRQHIKVTVVADGDGAKNCQVFIDGNSKSQFNLDPNQTWSQVYNAPEGNRMVGVNCDSVLVYNTTAAVSGPNMLLDFVDMFLGNVGSSNLATDAALR